MAILRIDNVKRIGRRPPFSEYFHQCPGGQRFFERVGERLHDPQPGFHGGNMRIALIDAEMMFRFYLYFVAVVFKAEWERSSAGGRQIADKAVPIPEFIRVGRDAVAFQVAGRGAGN